MSRISSETLARLSGIVLEQETKGIERKAFRIRLNYLMPATEPTFRQHIKLIKDEAIQISDLDLAIQVLSECMDYRTVDIWNGPKNLLAEAEELAITGDLATGHKRFAEHLTQSIITLNTDTISPISTKQFERLQTIVSAGESNGFPISVMNRRDKSPFNINGEEKGVVVLDKDGKSTKKVLYATERQSGIKIEFKNVEEGISLKYGQLFHFAHSSTDDETAAFGAFVRGDNYPFAWVSYCQINDSDVDKVLFLHNLGFDSQNIVALEKSWSAVWTPRNTMSLLYKFGATQIAIDKLSEGGSLHGVLTTVNPNLGLAGSSFLASNFDVVAQRPGRKVNGESDTSRCDLIYQIPVNEMLYTVDRKRALEVGKKKIFVVDESFIHKVTQKVTTNTTD